MIHPPRQRGPPPRDAAVVGEGLRQPHTDARAHGGGQADEEGAVGAVGQARRSEERRERRDRTVHQAQQGGLHLLQDEVMVGGFKVCGVGYT